MYTFYFEIFNLKMFIHELVSHCDTLFSNVNTPKLLSLRLLLHDIDH